MDDSRRRRRSSSLEASLSWRRESCERRLFSLRICFLLGASLSLLFLDAAADEFEATDESRLLWNRLKAWRNESERPSDVGVHGGLVARSSDFMWLVGTWRGECGGATSVKRRAWRVNEGA